MEYSFCHLMNLDRDLLSNILARLDGPCLAALACTCSELRDMAEDQSLWRELCHNTWPSTLLNETHHLVGGYQKFFADSYSLISYTKSGDNTGSQLCQSQEAGHHVSFSDFVSLVDIYHKGKCIFSKVLEGIPDMDIGYHNEIASNCERWFSNCPFKVDMLKYNSYVDTNYGVEIDENGNDDVGYDSYANNELSTAPPFPSEMWVDQYRKLMDNFRLSWVLLDKKRNKVVNLSSWKPLSVQRNWPLDDEYTMHFGCVMSIEDGILPEKLVKCKISATCMISQSETNPTWREVSLSIEDMEGACVTGRTGLMVLQQAAYCPRSTNYATVKAGIDCYERQRRKMLQRKDLKEKIADTMCVSIEVAVFLFFCYYFILSI